MRIRLRAGDKVFYIVNFIITTVVVFIILYPLWFVLCASVSDQARVFQDPAILLPHGYNLESYIKTIGHKDIWIGFKNSTIYTLCGTLINLLLTVFAAYPLSRPDFTGKSIFTFILTFTMFFSGGMIPTYIVVDSLGLINSMWALIIPTAINFTNVIIVRTYFKSSVPYEMQEAAQIDGCGNFRLLFSVIIPLSTPILAVITLYYSVGHWNSYFTALLYIYDRVKFPLQMFLRELLIQANMDSLVEFAESQQRFEQLIQKEGMKYAIVVISSLPFVMLFPFFQKYFSRGVMMGAIKG